MAGAPDKKNYKNERSITGDAATNNALWRLSLVLKEIAESTITKESIAVDNPKKPSSRVSRKALKSKKGGE